MRICSPYVALPFDPGRVRPELVGLLLHPVSRSETWRRLGTRRTLLQSPLGFHSKDAGPDSWRRAQKLPPQSLGGRVPDCRDEPIERKPNNELQVQLYLIPIPFLKYLKSPAVPVKHGISVTYIDRARLPHLGNVLHATSALFVAVREES